MKASRTGLLTAFRAQVRIDATDERQVQFLFFRRRKKVVGPVYVWVERFSGRTIRTAVALLYGVFVSGCRVRYEQDQFLAVFGKKNEEARLREIADPRFALAPWKARPAVSLLRDLLRARRIWRILWKANGAHPLYVVMRASALLLIYRRLRARFQLSRPAGIVISTATNPYGLALMGLGRTLGIPVIYASHGPISTGPLKLDCDLGLFYGRAARDSLQGSGSRVGAAIYYGFSESYRPLILPREIERVCICLSKNFDLGQVRALVEKLMREIAPREIRIRSHPDGLARLRSGALASLPGVVIRPGLPLDREIEDCDLAICGMSTVHLEVLLRGLPSIHYPAIDWGGTEVLEFVREGLVPELERLPGPRELVALLLLHYGEPGWARAFERYMNISQPRAAFQRCLEQSLAELGRR